MDFFTKVLSVNSRLKSERAREAALVNQTFQENLENMKGYLASEERDDVLALLDMVYDSSFPEEQIFLKTPSSERLNSRKELVVRLLIGLDSLGVPVMSELLAFVKKHGLDGVEDSVMVLIELISPLLEGKKVPEFSTDDFVDAIDTEWHSSSRTGSPLLNVFASATSSPRASSGSVGDVSPLHPLTAGSPYRRVLSDRSMFSSRARELRSKSVLDKSHMSVTPPPASQLMPASMQNSSFKQDLVHSSKTKILANPSPQSSHASTDKKPSAYSLDIHPEHLPQRLHRRKSSSLRELFAEDEDDKLVPEGPVGASSKRNSSSSSMRRTSSELSKFIATTASETSSSPMNPGQSAQRAGSLETEDKRFLLNVENQDRRQNGVGSKSSRETSLSHPTDQMAIFGEDAGGLSPDHVSNKEDATQNSVGPRADMGVDDSAHTVENLLKSSNLHTSRRMDDNLHNLSPLSRKSSCESLSNVLHASCSDSAFNYGPGELSVAEIQADRGGPGEGPCNLCLVAKQDGARKWHEYSTEEALATRNPIKQSSQVYQELEAIEPEKMEDGASFTQRDFCEHDGNESDSVDAHSTSGQDATGTPIKQFSQVHHELEAVNPENVENDILTAQRNFRECEGNESDCVGFHSTSGRDNMNEDEGDAVAFDDGEHTVESHHEMNPALSGNELVSEGHAHGWEAQSGHYTSCEGDSEHNMPSSQIEAMARSTCSTLPLQGHAGQISKGSIKDELKHNDVSDADFWSDSMDNENLKRNSDLTGARALFEQEKLGTANSGNEGVGRMQTNNMAFVQHENDVAREVASEENKEETSSHSFSSPSSSSLGSVEDQSTAPSGSDADKGLSEVMNVDDEALRPLEQEFELQISDTDADTRQSYPSYDQGEDMEGPLLSSGKLVPDLGDPRSTSHKEDAGHTSSIKGASLSAGNQAEDVHHPSKDSSHEEVQDELSFPKGDAQCADNSVEAGAGTDANISDKGKEDAGDKQAADFEQESCKSISDSKGSNGEGKASSKGSNGEGFGIYPILAPLLVSSANDVPGVVDQVIAGSSQHFDEEADNGRTALAEDMGDAHSLPKEATDGGGLHAFEENARYTHADDLHQKGCEATASDKVKPSGSSEGVSLAQQILAPFLVPASSNASQFDDNDDASDTSSTNPEAAEQGLNCSKRSGNNEKHVDELHGAILPTFEDLQATKEAKAAHGGGGDAQSKDGQALMEKAWEEETNLGQKIIENKSARVAVSGNSGSTDNENPEPEMPELNSIEDGNKQNSDVDPQHVCHENLSKSAAQEDHLKVSDDQFDKLLSEVEANEDNEQQPNDSRDRRREMDIASSSPRDRKHEEYDSASRPDEQKSAAKMPAVPAYPLETFGGSKDSGRDEGSGFVKPSSEGSDNGNANAGCYNHQLPDNIMQTGHSFPPHVSDAMFVEDQSTSVQESEHQLMVNSRECGTQCKMSVPAADAHASGATDASESRVLHGDADPNNGVRASNLSTLTDTAFPQEDLLASNLSSSSSTGFLQEDFVNKPADHTEDMDTDVLRSKRKGRRSGKLARGFLACCTKLRTSDF